MDWLRVGDGLDEGRIAGAARSKDCDDKSLRLSGCIVLAATVSTYCILGVLRYLQKRWTLLFRMENWMNRS